MEQYSSDWHIELQNWLAQNSRTESTEKTELRNAFLDRFPKEKLGALTLEEYALGRGSRDTFCYWLEYETRPLGGMGGASAKKFRVWWSRTEKRWRWVSRYSSAKDAFENVRTGLVELGRAVERGQFDALDEIGGQYLGANNNMLRVKVLSLYFPEQFLPIFQPQHLEYFMRLFGESARGEVIHRNLQLLKEMRALPEFQGFDTRQMASFLYDCFSPKPKHVGPIEIKDELEGESQDNAKELQAQVERTERAALAHVEPQLVTGLEGHPELESEEEEEEAVPDAKPVLSQARDWTISVLREKMDRNQIDLQPKYQREYVWRLKPELPSRLIESLLLDIPIPPVYLGKLPGGKLDVIDGQQRLTTLINFVGNKFPLQKLVGLKSLNGSYFRDLSEEQQSKILDAPIHSIVIDAGNNLNLRYEIFERLNRGSMSLNEQELRTCVYRGLFADLLIELEATPIWRKIKGTAEPEPRFAEREMILRFFALAQRIDAYSGNLKKFLNDYMGDYAPKEPDKIQSLRQMFLQTMENVYAVFGAESGRLFTRGSTLKPTAEGRWEPKFSISALDIQAGALVGQTPAQVRANAARIKQAYMLYLTANPQILEAITKRPAAKEATRLRWLGFKLEVQKILAGHDSDYSAGGTHDPLKDAKLLLQIGLVEAAGIRAGVALENHLKNLCKQQRPPIELEAKDTLWKCNLALKNASVFDNAQFLQVQWMSDIRNRSAHAGMAPVTRQEIVEMIAKVQDIVAKYPLSM